MRELTDHIVNPANDKIKIEVTDEPGEGGANHRYKISGMHLNNNRSRITAEDPIAFLTILFQNGPIQEHGVNGITQEVLLAIVADRLRAFQAGPFACPENRNALMHVEDALTWLKSRTQKRMERGVEGQNVA